MTPLMVPAALVVFALLVGLFVRRPGLGVCLVIATAPLEKLSFYAGLTWKPFLLLTPSLGAALLWRWWKKKDSAPRFERLEGALLAILLCSLASMAVAEAPLRTLRMTVQYLALFTVVWAILQTLRTPRDIERGLQVLTLSGLGVMLYGVLQFAGWAAGREQADVLLWLMPRNPTLPESFTAAGMVRIPGAGSLARLSSTFFDWNIFAALLVLILSLSLSNLGWRLYTGRWWRWELLYSGLGLFLLAFTFSRSAWAGMAAALVVVAAGWLRHLRASRARLAAAAVAFALFVAVGASLGPWGALRGRVAILFRGDLSARQHLVYARAALEMFRRSPALGIGLHNYSNYYTRHFDPEDLGSTAHSAFLSFFAETGLLGAAANLALMGIVLAALWRIIRRSRPEQPAFAWAVGLAAAYVGLLTSSLFYLFYNQVYLWALVGLILALERTSRNDEAAQEDTGFEGAR